ncbi:MAG: hypothetical protein A2X28_06500 [Elusimicrobia bacterium GWA2_56_46]|nr:MAG: hypothetical protein A2X28_06500 [Elusimicrobia bacterium GWA2_56_46]OGR54898.1 MAG: hypothetical protein A2X39_11490 [Elusimicrobia bacterium GWC2_56_31]HBB67287.1 thioredoxin family protein [Elusimicrobiota bacterium]HBW23306.1 thioredoxin family protein [Elusimicrobiota bacterium]
MIKIQILGMGCAKCARLYAAVETAAKELGIEYEMEKVDDIDRITERGVMMTPALVINDEVKFAGRVPSLEDLKKIILAAK